MIPASLESAPRCGARTNRGTPCKGPARRGSNRCRKHGGNAPQVRAAAERRMAEQATVAAVEQYGTPRRIDALDALEGELHRTQGHVDWLAEQIARNPDPAWLTVYQSERSHLARLSQQMISANVAERRTVVAEQTVARLETALRATLRDLGQDPDAARVRAALTRNLQSASADVRHGSDLRHGTSNGRVTIDAPPDNVYPLPVDF